MLLRSVPCPCKPDLPEVDEPPIPFEMETELPSLRCLKKRGEEKREQQELLADFLAHNKFSDVNEPRGLGCSREAYYPVHAAAVLGDREVLRLLLRAGASCDQRSSRGRTALQMAQQADKEGSHAAVIGLLQTKVKCLSVKGLVSLTA